MCRAVWSSTASFAGHPRPATPVNAGAQLWPRFCGGAFMRDALPTVAPAPPVPDPSRSRLPAAGQPGFADALGECIAKPVADHPDMAAPASPLTEAPPPAVPSLLPFLAPALQKAALPPGAPAPPAEAEPEPERDGDAENPEAGQVPLVPLAPNLPVPPPLLPQASMAAPSSPPAAPSGDADVDTEAPGLAPSQTAAESRPERQAEPVESNPKPAPADQPAQAAPPGPASPVQPMQGHAPHRMEQPPAPPPMAPAAPASPTALPLPSPPTTPMQQVMPAVASVAAAPRDGAPHVLTIRLDPVELGRVQVRIEQAADGPARVSLVAERPQTLQLLQQDQPQLHRALDLAGVPAEGRVIQFQLAPDPPAAREGGTSFMAGGSAGGFGNPGEGGQPGQRPPDRHGSRYMLDPSPPGTRPGARRLAGIDITT